jgi:hypothetical protein
MIVNYPQLFAVLQALREVAMDEYINTPSDEPTSKPWGELLRALERFIENPNNIPLGGRE